jgi:hypothetical protein
MLENSIMNKDWLANAASADTQLKAKKKFVEPRLSRHETLIENTLDGGGIGSTGVTGGVTVIGG